MHILMKIGCNINKNTISLIEINCTKGLYKTLLLLLNLVVIMLYLNITMTIGQTLYCIRN